MNDYTMPAGQARELLAALTTRGVTASVGGGWAVDALVGRQTREHHDLDLWLPAADLDGLFACLSELGLDRIHPWPSARPWNFVLQDGRSRRVDLHLYESLGDGQLHYGSVVAPFRFTVDDLSGAGDIDGSRVTCELPGLRARQPDRLPAPRRRPPRRGVAVRTVRARGAGGVPRSAVVRSCA